jgi:hypothetical protein
MGQLSILWNMVISQFYRAQSFINFVEHGHFSILVEPRSTFISVEHGHFSILWNIVISQFGRTMVNFQFCGTWSFLNSIEHSHFSILWNMVELVELNHFGVIAGLFRQIGGHSKAASK